MTDIDREVRQFDSCFRQLLGLTELCGIEITAGEESSPFEASKDYHTDGREESAEDMSCLRPKDAQVVFISTSPEGEVIVRMPASARHPFLDFRVKPSMVRVGQFPPDSVFVCLLFVDRNLQVVLGVFDVLRLEGDGDVACERSLQRHARVAKTINSRMVSQSTERGVVRHHWAGFRESCNHLLTPETAAGLPFEIDPNTPLVVLPGVCGKGCNVA
tara:strand:- start:7890 stop:8537 length:648 start_codon:yes stop_codon:yes gene_type:complete